MSEGSSTLVDSDADQLRDQLHAVLNGTYKHGHCPELWDGHASERIAQVLVDSF